MKPHKKITEQPWFHYSVATCSAVVLFLLLSNFNKLFSSFFGTLRTVLSPLIIGLITAYLVDPVVKSMEKHVFRKIEKRKLRRSFSMVLAVIIVMVGILAGWFTATEAGVVCILYCTVLAICYREITFRDYYDMLADTMVSSSTILFLISASTIMSYVMSFTGIPGAISNALMSVSSNRYVILLIMNVFLLIMGMFLDLTPAVLIFTPIFLPIATSVGMNPVHFGLMLIMNLGIGSVTPPVGSCLFVGCGIAHTKIEGVTPYIVKIFAAMVAALFAVTFIPAIPMIIPYLLGLVDKFWW